MSFKVLVIDNYDSFVYNLVQYLGELKVEPLVKRHDAITIDEVENIAPNAILISPGPGKPKQAGISIDLIKWAVFLDLEFVIHLNFLFIVKLSFDKAIFASIKGNFSFLFKK